MRWQSIAGFSIGSVMACGWFISTARWTYSLFLQFSPWRISWLRHFIGYSLGTSKKKVSTTFYDTVFSKGCVIGKGWCFISWNSKGVTNKVPPSWSPSAEKLEKKSLFSASCWNKTTICYDRAFLKRTTTNRWNASALGPTTKKQGKRAVFSPYTERKLSYSMTKAINSIPWKGLPFPPYRHKGKARYSMWLFHPHSMVKREAFSLISPLMDSMIGGFYWLFPWYWGK